MRNKSCLELRCIARMETVFKKRFKIKLNDSSIDFPINTLVENGNFLEDIVNINVTVYLRK